MENKTCHLSEWDSLKLHTNTRAARAGLSHQRTSLAVPGANTKEEEELKVLIASCRRNWVFRL